MSDPRFAAAIDLIGRTGAKGFQIRYDDEQDPVVWVAYAEWLNGDEAAGALEPLTAVLRLMALVMSGARGARCAHCGNPSGVSDDWRNPLPFSDEVCWFVFDPELAKYRRSCEGDTTGYAYGRDPATGRAVGRNNPCPCGSGFKWKRCHGRGTT